MNLGHAVWLDGLTAELWVSTDVPQHVLLPLTFTWGPEIQTQDLMPASQTLYPLRHVPNHQDHALNTNQDHSPQVAGWRQWGSVPMPLQQLCFQTYRLGTKLRNMQSRRVWGQAGSQCTQLMENARKSLMKHGEFPLCKSGAGFITRVL